MNKLELSIIILTDKVTDLDQTLNFLTSIDSFQKGDAEIIICSRINTNTDERIIASHQKRKENKGNIIYIRVEERLQEHELRAIAESQASGKEIIDAQKFLEVYHPKSGISSAKTGEFPIKSNFSKNSSQKKVLMTMYGWAESGGGTILPRSIAKELARRGWDVSVFYASLKSDITEPAYSIERHYEDGVKLYGIYNRPALFIDPNNPEREISDHGILNVFKIVLDEVQPDLVHFHNFHGLTFAIAEEVEKRSIPSCYTPHNYHLIDPNLYLFNSDLSLWNGVDLISNSEAVKKNPEKLSFYKQRIETTRKLLNEWVSCTLAVSRRQRELLIEHGGNPDKILVVHQANEITDRLWEKEIPLSPHFAMSDLKQINKPLSIGFIGGVMPHKGVHILVAAAQAFNSEQLEVRIYGFVSEQYLSLLKSFDKKGIVKFSGEYKIDDLWKIASEIDIAIVPSVWEDCAPLVLLELNAMRLPVIAANIGGIPDFITHNVNGFLYKYDSAEELIRVIADCIQNPVKIFEMKKNLKQIHSFKNYVSHIEKIYHKFIEEGELKYDDFNLIINTHKPIPTQIPDSTPITSSKITSGELSFFKFEFQKEESVKSAGVAIGETVEIPLNPPSTRGDINYEIPLNIVWEGSQFVYHSLALINREICSKIIEANVANLTIIPYENDRFSPEGNPKYEKLRSNDIRFKTEQSVEIKKKPYCWIRHQWPPKAEPPKGAKWFIMQPWEFTQLRKDFVEIFKQADEIWTPSMYSRQCFINSGLDFNKVQVIPNGIDPQLFTPVGVKFNLPTHKKFKFLYIGGTIFRKGIDILLQSYTQTFRASDDVCLVIKDMGGDSFYRGQTAKETISQIRKNPNSPEIIYYDNEFTENEIASLYRACNVFVCPYRGEGFSLPTLEAMASGLPVIVTKGGATEDFVDEQVGWLISAGKISIGNKIDGYPLTGEAFLLQPDANELGNILISIYSEPSICYTKGMLASYRARKQWTWRRSTIKALSRIDFHYGTSLARKAEEKLPEFVDASMIFGEAEKLLLQNNFPYAVEKYQYALASGDLNPQTTFLSNLRLAFIKINQSEFEEATSYIELAENINPDNPDILYIKSLLLYNKNELTEGIETITPLLENWNSIRFDSLFGYRLDDILSLTGFMFYESNDIDGAAELFESALKLNNENLEACFGSALCHRASGNYGEAKSLLEKILQIEPGYQQAREELEGIMLHYG